MPNTRKKESYYLKKQREARCRSRAGIEGLISPETRSQDAKKLSERHGWRPNQHIIGSISIQYDEMDEDETRRIFYCLMANLLPDINFCSGKYPSLMNDQKK